MEEASHLLEPSDLDHAKRERDLDAIRALYGAERVDPVLDQAMWRLLSTRGASESSSRHLPAEG
jgi:hypothetical protein